MYARIQNGYVVDVRTNSPIGCFTDNFVSQFISIPDEVENGWLFDGTSYIAPPEPPQPTQEELDAMAAQLVTTEALRVQSSIIQATQARLDTFAQSRNYDNILSACTYAPSSIPKFAVEGQYCVNVRDTTWATLYTILGEVQAQTRQMPSNFADVEPLLPVLVWPV